MASRLHELEMEKQHTGRDQQDTRRTDQAHESTDVLMGGGGGGTMTEDQKQTLMSQIQHIVDKPVTIIQKIVLGEEEGGRG